MKFGNRLIEISHAIEQQSTKELNNSTFSDTVRNDDTSLSQYEHEFTIFEVCYIEKMMK
jgi:hypothetical protein